MPAAFMPRPTESSLSVNWLEYLAVSGRQAEIDELRRVFIEEKRYQLRPSGCFALLNVGETTDYVAAESLDSRRLRFVHEPVEEESCHDPSHSGIHGYAHEDLVIAQLIVDTVTETHPGL